MRHARTAFTLLILSAVVLTLTATPAQAYEPGPGEAVLYRATDCTGTPFIVVKSGVVYDDLRLRDMGTGELWEHAVGCIHVGPDTRVTIYTKSNYRGVSLTLTREARNPAGVWTLGNRWNDDISSLKVH